MDKQSSTKIGKDEDNTKGKSNSHRNYRQLKPRSATLGPSPFQSRCNRGVGLVVLRYLGGGPPGDTGVDYWDY